MNPSDNSKAEETPQTSNLQQDEMNPSDNSKAEETPQTSNLQQDEMNPSDNSKAEETPQTSNLQQIREAPQTFDLQQLNGKIHAFYFCHDNKTYAVSCDTSQTVLNALDTSQVFKQLKERNYFKEIVIKRQKEAWEITGAAVKSDFPCCLIQKDEMLNIDFIQKRQYKKYHQKHNANEKPSFSGDPETLVTFNIKTKGGELKRLMRNMELRLEVEDVCVYAFKGETLKNALSRDGRFIEKIFERNCVLLDLGNNTMYELSNRVDNINGKCFQIKVMSNTNQVDGEEQRSAIKTTGAGAVAKTEQNKGKPKTTTKSKISQIECEIIPKSETLVKILRDHYKEVLNELKQKMNDEEIKQFFRAEYDKSNQSFSEVKKVKKLMSLSNSVCQIRKEGSAKGTGFLLFDRFILTNAHVIGEFDPFTKKLSKTLTAAFGFEDLNQTVKPVPIKEHFTAIFHGDDDMRYLDYALLELDDHNVCDHIRLLSQYQSGLIPNRGGICIIGHPSEVKRMDICFIIERENRLKAADKHISENRNFYHVMKQQETKEKWMFSKNQITYDSCFFHGSSGSPVFDEDCWLIGIHTGGYVYPGEGGKRRSVMEYAFSMQPILENIVIQAKNERRTDIIELLSEYEPVKSLIINMEGNDVDMAEEPQNQEDMM